MGKRKGLRRAMVLALLCAALAAVWLLLPSAARALGLPAEDGRVTRMKFSSTHAVTEQWELTEPEDIARVPASLRDTKVVFPQVRGVTGTMIIGSIEFTDEAGGTQTVRLYMTGARRAHLNGGKYIVLGLPATRDAWRALLEGTG